MKPTVGTAMPRVDAGKKVTGRATYAADTDVQNVLHAVIVTSAIARGSLRALDDRAAVRAPGVVAVLWHATAPKLPPAEASAQAQERVLQLLQDDAIHYQDQPIAVVVADTLEHAQAAAALVTASYRPDGGEPAVAAMTSELGAAFAPPKAQNESAASSRGDFVAGWAAAHARVDQIYTTPIVNHNPMEPHATVAMWRSATELTLYDATQGIFGVRSRIAKAFGLPAANVRVIDAYVGGGFGCKGSAWSHVALCALAAKAVGRPVKLVVTRPQMFSLVGHRPPTHQHVKLGALADGTLTAISHDSISETSRFDMFLEPAALATRMLYACSNVVTSHEVVKLDVPTPTFMRAPGESTGTFALESAIDELAVALAMDPLALRRKNYAEADANHGKPFSSKSLRECYDRGAEAFGWSKRPLAPRTLRRDGKLVGWGMATATYPANMWPASCKVELRADGTATVLAGTQDLGTGTYTIMRQIAADALGVPFENVAFDLGDTAYPETRVSGGSSTASSVGSAIKVACEQARAQLANAMALGRDRVTIEHANPEKPERAKYSTHAFGADFVEVEVDEDLGEIAVTRVVGAFAAGKILNRTTARSQLIGGLVWAIGMALREDSRRDPRTARAVTRDLADYHVPVHADVPDMDIIMVDEVDPYVNDIGAKGLGEIGITGATAAIANAVFHATGVRVRDLPVTLDKLLVGIGDGTGTGRPT